MLLEEIKQQTDEEIRKSGYYRIFGDVDIARLAQLSHIGTIKKGNKLEEILFVSSAIPNKVKNYKFGKEKQFPSKKNEPFFVTKFHIPAGTVMDAGVDIDLVLFLKNEVYIIELKDGTTFDTKKSAGEITKITKTAKYLQEHDPYGREFIPIVAVWNATDKKQISIKDKRATKEMLMIGRELSNLLKINYDHICNSRMSSAPKNKKYILNQWKQILIAEGEI